MLNNSSKIMFLLILILGTMITISSNSWVSAWMGLEINLLSFIPLMSDNNLMATEASLKYFLTQALASTVFLFAVIIFMMENFYSIKLTFFTKLMILSALLLKSGAAPFHFWFPNVMQGLSWPNSLILMTWQKIAPFLLISYIIIKPMIMFCAILSAILGAIGGLNQTSLLKILSYSSINHISWMLVSMMYSETLWLYYFYFYSFLSFSLILMFYIFNMHHINQLFNLSIKSKIMKFFSMMNLLSLGGLPPFMGFIPKWLVIQYLSMNNQLMMMLILVMSALITLFFYLRLCYTSFMLNYSETNWMYKIQFNKFLMMVYLSCSFMSTTTMIIITSLYFML